MKPTNSPQKQVHFGQDATEVIIIHDTPSQEEEHLVYDTRSEDSVFDEARQVILDSPEPLPGAVGFQQSVETLYRKKKAFAPPPSRPAARRGSLVFRKKSTRELDAPKEVPSHKLDRIPRHFQWAVRTICESDLRGLEQIYNGPLIEQHRKDVVQSVLEAQEKSPKGKTITIPDETLALMQHSAYVALLMGQGDRQAAIPATPPRTLHNPAA